MRTALQTALTERLGLEIPLIQAPMAGVSTPEMAAAVSNAGALGSVALGALKPDAAREALARTRKLTEGPIAANVFAHPPPRRDPALERAYLQALEPLFARFDSAAPAALEEIYRSFNDDDAMLEAVLSAHPEAVSLHFGPAAPERVRQIKDAGCFLMATATTVAEALLLEDSGVDAVVAQSYSAGGHSGAFLGPPTAATAGKAGLVALVQDMVDAVSVPVIAAGGLMTGADIHECLEAGAAGAQLGTAFVGCPESLASPAYRARLEAGGETALTSAVSGRPARGLVNPLMNSLERSSAVRPDYPLTYDAVKQLVAVADDPAFAVMWAGEGGGAIRRLPAIELVRILETELLSSLARF